jgi:hypothetical protein
MKKSTLTLEDKQFFIKMAKAVDGIKAKQKAHETFHATLDHNIHAAHQRLDRIEAELNQAAMFVTFKDLMPGPSVAWRRPGHGSTGS